MPRYVILEHDYPTRHWDLMLESGTALRTWRLAELPRAACIVRATALLDHRTFYLDYEGPVSGGRGHVSRWDAGEFTWQEKTSKRMVVSLQGSHLRGRAVLCEASEAEWSFLLEAALDPGAVTTEEVCR